MKRFTAAILTLCALYAQPVLAQLTVPFTFSPSTTILSAQVNSNFAQFAFALDLRGGTMTGTLTTLDVVPTTTDTYSVGSATKRYQHIYLSNAIDVNAVVAIDSLGRIPSIDATHFASLNGALLTNLNANNIATGQMARARLNLQMAGVTKAIDYIVVGGVDDYVLASGTHTITLPDCTALSGAWVNVKKTDAGTTTTIATTGGQTIDGAATQALSVRYTNLTLVCDGANWNIF